MGLGVLAAACTSDDTGDTASSQSDGDAADVGEVADDGPPWSGAIEPLDLDLPDELAVTGESFTPHSLDHFSNRVLAAGTYTEAGEPPVPAVFHAAAEEPASWRHTQTLLPDGYVATFGGGASAVDADNVLVAHHISEDRQRHASVWTKTAAPDLLAVIDDVTPVSVANVFSHDGDLVAVGSTRDGDGRRPLAWRLSDGEARPVDLPDDVEGYLTAGVSIDDEVVLFGVVDEDDEVFALAGDDLEALEPRTYAGLDEVRSILTAVVTDSGTVWVAGSVPGSATGIQYVWVLDGDELDGRGEQLWDDVQTFSSSASRLVAQEGRGEDIVAVANGDITWVWAAVDDEIDRHGALGGKLATFDGYEPTTLTYDPRRDEYRLAEESFELDLPSVPAQLGRPFLHTARDGVLGVTVGHQEDRVTHLVRDGQVLDTVDGDATIRSAGDTTALTSVVHVDANVRPGLAELDVDTGAATDVPLDGVDDDVNAARARLLIEHDGRPTVLGHVWVDNDLEPLGWQRGDDGWEPLTRFEGLEPGRGFADACGESAAITYDEYRSVALARSVDGRFEETPLPARVSRRSRRGCEVAADDAAWLATSEELLRVDDDVESTRPDDLETVYGLGLAADDEVVVLVGSTVGASGTLTVWATEVGDLDGWHQLDTLEPPVGTTSLQVVGTTEDERLVVAGRLGHDPLAWQVTVTRD